MRVLGEIFEAISARFSRIIATTVVLMSISANPVPASAGAEILSIGSLPGLFRSEAIAVNADGTIIAGYSYSTDSMQARGFIWTRSNGLQSIGALPGGMYSTPYAIDANGTAATGFGQGVSGDYRAFRWSATSGMSEIGAYPAGTTSYGYGISSDGRVIVGAVADKAFRWTATEGLQIIDTQDGAAISFSWTANSDGSVIVGDRNRQSFRWTSAHGMQDLLGTNYLSSARGVNAAGNVVVGSYEVPGSQPRRYQAFRWSSELGMLPLGTLAGGTESLAFGTDASGGIIVGGSASSIGYRAFRWTQREGMRDLAAYLSSMGADLTGWDYLNVAWSVSADGRVVVGRGSYMGLYRGFVAFMPAACSTDLNLDGQTDGSDIGILLGQWNAQGPNSADVSGDGLVGGADLGLLLANWGPCSN